MVDNVLCCLFGMETWSSEAGSSVVSGMHYSYVCAYVCAVYQSMPKEETQK